MTGTHQTAFSKNALIIVGSVLCAVMLTGASASAQDQQRSHRLLPLPAGRPADMRQQLEFLNRLQRLMGVDDPTSGPFEAPPGIAELLRDSDPEQLQLLRKLIEQSMRQSDSNPGAGTESPTSDPETRLLQPQAPAQLPQNLQQAWNDPLVRQQAQRMLEQLHNDRAGRRQGNGERVPGLPQDDQMSNPLPSWLRDIVPDDGARAAGLQQSASQDSSNRIAPPSRNATSEPGESAAKRDSSPLNNGERETQQRKPPSTQQPDNLRELVQDLAKSLDAQTTPGNADPNATATRKGDGGSPAAPAKPTTSGEPTMQGQREFLDPLDQDELKLAFQEILKEAVADGARSGDPAALPEDVRESVMKILNGMHGDLVDVLKDVMLRNGEQQATAAGAPPGGGAPPDSAPRNSGPSAVSPPAAESASQWLDRLTKAPAGSPASGAANSFWTSGFSASSLMTALLILAAAFIAAHFLRKKFLDRSAGTERALRDLRLMQVNCGADVVTAFHQLVAITKNPAEVWWPHRRAARALTLDAPSTAVAAEILADLYERVRYLPSGATLTAEQLEEARAAIRRCASC